MTYLPLAGRVCLALIFLKAGIGHLLGFSGFVSTIASKGLPIPAVVGVGAIVALLAGALSLILGYKVKIGAILLIVFLIPTTLLFHPPVAGQFNDFLKNLGLIGGLLIIMSSGPGLISVDGSK